MSDNRWNDKIKLTSYDRLFARTIEPFVPRWLAPNHITIARILLTPAVLFFLFRGNYGVGVPLFIFVAATDALDGMLARVRRQVTEWGIIYDPIADKMLIGSVLFVIVLEHVNFYIGLALLIVEVILVIGGWFMRVRKGVQQADIWGKIKMNAEVAGILLLLIALWSGVDLFVDLSTGTLTVALIVAIISIFSRLV